jgi:hypothetical protein
MKKISIIIFLVFIASYTDAQTGAFKVTNSSAIQLGYQNYRWLGFGFNSASPTSNQSQWAIEHWDGGLNFWKPWPSANAGNYKLILADGGCVGINCHPLVYNISAPNSDKLHVNGKITSRGHFTWSDSRTKCQINNLDPALNTLLTLRTVSYFDRVNITIGNYQHDSIQNGDSTKYFPSMGSEYCDTLKHFGLIAQEVKNIYPSLVSETQSGVLALNYVEIVPLLIKSTQELNSIIEGQKLEIENLRQEIVNWKGKTIDSPSDKTRLFQNNPNPFNGNTTFTYFIDENTAISSAVIEVRNIMGMLQTTLSLGDRSGLGEIEYNGSSLTHGYYIFTLKINGSVKDSKMFLKEN